MGALGLIVARATRPHCYELPSYQVALALARRAEKEKAK